MVVPVAFGVVDFISLYGSTPNLFVVPVESVACRLILLKSLAWVTAGLQGEQTSPVPRQ